MTANTFDSDGQQGQREACKDIVAGRAFINFHITPDTVELPVHNRKLAVTLFGIQNDESNRLA